MSNPLLRPGDPRFQQAEIRDAAGKNRFADEMPAGGNAANASDVYASAAGDGPQPFAAHYPVQRSSRAVWLMFLGGVGWGAAAVGVFSFTGWFDVLWLSPFLGVAPAGAAWLLAHEELKAIRAGAISSDAERQTRQAFWLGLTGLMACVGVAAAMICHALRLLPNL